MSKGRKDLKAHRVSRASRDRKGSQGNPGVNGVSGYEIVTATATSDGVNTTAAVVKCSGGKNVLSGGWSASTTPSFSLYLDTPTNGPGWAAAVGGGGLPNGATLDVFAICATTS